MTPDTSGWRDEAAYRFMDEAGVDELAWECLRRNVDYQQDFAHLRERALLDEPLPRAISDRWGLRFRRATKSLRPRRTCPLDVRG